MTALRTPEEVARGFMVDREWCPRNVQPGTAVRVLADEIRADRLAVIDAVFRLLYSDETRAHGSASTLADLRREIAGS